MTSQMALRSMLIAALLSPSLVSGCGVAEGRDAARRTEDTAAVAAGRVVRQPQAGEGHSD